MTQVNIYNKTPQENPFVNNGDMANTFFLDDACNAVLARKNIICSQSWPVSNAPVLQAVTWSGTTSPTYTTTVRLRADLPVLLEGSIWYSVIGAKTDLVLRAEVTLQNTAVAASRVDYLKVYNGDSATAGTQWYLQDGMKHSFAAGQVRTIRLEGTCHPKYRDNAGRLDSNAATLCVDAASFNDGTPFKLLGIKVWFEGVKAVADIPVKPSKLTSIAHTEWSGYVAALETANASYGQMTRGCFCPVAYGSPAVYGYAKALTSTSYDYLCFGLGYATTTVNGSYLVPLTGRGYFDVTANKYKYKISMIFYMYNTTYALSYQVKTHYFLPGSTSRTTAQTTSGSLGANSGKWIEEVVTIESATVLQAVAISPTIKRVGGSATTMYCSQLACKVIPYSSI